MYPDVSGLIGRRAAAGTILRSDVHAFPEEAGLAAVAGSVFGFSPHVRLSFAAATPTLDELARRTGAFCEGLADGQRAGHASTGA